MKLHPKVLQFAEAMQTELNANMHKGLWEEWGDVTEMIADLEWHKAKLLIAMRDGEHAKVREYLADCGNILMFIGNAGSLYEPTTTIQPKHKNVSSNKSASNKAGKKKS